MVSILDAESAVAALVPMSDPDPEYVSFPPASLIGRTMLGFARPDESVGMKYVAPVCAFCISMVRR